MMLCTMPEKSAGWRYPIRSHLNSYLYFTLTKEKDNEIGSKLLAWVVRGFVHRTSGVAQPVINVVNSTPAPYDLRAYWQAHRHSP